MFYDALVADHSIALVTWRCDYSHKIPRTLRIHGWPFIQAQTVTMRKLIRVLGGHCATVYGSGLDQKARAGACSSINTCPMVLTIIISRLIAAKMAGWMTRIALRTDK